MSIYKKGRRKEYTIVEKLRKEGFDIVQRTAGSNSPIDIIAISKDNKLIKFIQSKRLLSKSISDVDERLKRNIERDMKWLRGNWSIVFEVL